MKTSRVLISTGLAAGVIAAIVCVPLPHYISAPVLLQPRGAEAIYVEVPGEVVEVWVNQGVVQAGQELARLTNIDAELAAQKLRARRDQLSTKIEGLRQRSHSENQALLELAQTEEALAALSEQLNQREAELRKLTIVAPFAGQFLPPPERTNSPSDRVTLASWQGRPLAAKNRGVFLEKGTLLGKVAPAGQFEAVLAIDQNAMEFVRPGQSVEIVLHQWPGQKVRGTIEHLSEQPWNAVPPSLSTKSGGLIATHTGSDGGEHPLSETYQASVPLLAETDDRWVAEGTGEAWIQAGSMTMAQHAWRMICRTFRFEL